jgi:hypothetical protein
MTGALYILSGVRVAERNDQEAGTKGSDVRTNGECVGTRYGVMMWDIYRKRGERRKAERVPKPSSGTRLRNGYGKPSEFWGQSLGTGLGNGCSGMDLNTRLLLQSSSSVALKPKILRLIP